ncbi:MAG: hypothetical protein KatS3mg131_3574 [Candidatus Tectimicrobiota bacterium]|nr:MAG: hypothetical protein KatS3mg131_3574 [Candidatus Tectomicrobia bacterium]
MAVSTLPAWQDKPLEEVLRLCRDVVEDPALPTVRRWREAGGKVVGHFQVYFPEEIVHAAGMLPLKIRGAPLEPLHADSRFGSYLCSILKTSLELVLSGRLVLDMFVSHPICDAARNLAAVWGRNTTYPCQILYLPQNANSAHALTYLREEYVRLQRDVEAVAGRPVRDEDLRRSLAVFNENRALLRQLYAIKRDHALAAGSGRGLRAHGHWRHDPSRRAQCPAARYAAAHRGAPCQAAGQDPRRLRRGLLRAAAA